jgi:hypothetical protein
MNSWTLTAKLVEFLLWFATFTPSERVALIAAFLVLAGVAGEYLIEVPTIDKRERLRKGIKQVSMALLLLGLAGDVLGIVIGQAQMAVLMQESAQLNRDAEGLRKQAEDEQAARIKIQATVAWRRLPKDQQSVIADHLRNFPEVRIAVSYLGGMPESSEFADDIKAALRAAKLNLRPREPYSLFGGYGGGVQPLRPLTGVNISGVGNRGSKVAAAIQRELCAVGFDTTITDKPNAGIFEPHPDIDIAVLVVGRPVTEQGAAQLKINTKTRDCTASQ